MPKSVSGVVHWRHLLNKASGDADYEVCLYSVPFILYKSLSVKLQTRLELVADAGNVSKFPLIDTSAPNVFLLPAGDGIDISNQN